jgi:hypothetical protein
MRAYIKAENYYNKRQVTERQWLQADRRIRLQDTVQQNPVEDLEQVMGILEERRKLPRRVVLTRWLSSAEAVRLELNCRHVYINFLLTRLTKMRVTYWSY